MLLVSAFSEKQFLLHKSRRGGSESQPMRKACFPFLKKLSASARMPRSCIQHLSVSPACSFPNDCHLPPCSALHGCWKPILSHFSTLLNVPTALPSHLPQIIINSSFLHSSTDLMLPTKPNKPSAASSLSEALKHQA